MMMIMMMMMMTGAGAAAVHDSVPRRGGHAPRVPGGAGAHGQGQGEAGHSQEARQAPAGQQVQETRRMTVAPFSHFCSPRHFIPLFALILPFAIICYLLCMAMARRLIVQVVVFMI